MARHVDRERIRAAQLAGEAQRLRHLTISNSDRYEEIRAAWPELADRIEAVAAFVDWDRFPDA